MTRRRRAPAASGGGQTGQTSGGSGGGAAAAAKPAGMARAAPRGKNSARPLRPRCQSCGANALERDEQGRMVCAVCASQSQEFGEDEQAEADNMSLGVIAMTRTRKRGSRRGRSPSPGEDAEQRALRMRRRAAAGDEFSEEELLSGLQAIVRAQTEVCTPAGMLRLQGGGGGG
eukprot:SAG22_NODE_4331_length_1301_cov_0.975042_2_plen_172_part_01